MDSEENEIDLRQTYEEDDEIGFNAIQDDGSLLNEAQIVPENMEGFATLDSDGEEIVEPAEESYFDLSDGDEEM